MEERIGFIGLGVMGRSMAHLLLAKFKNLNIYSRTKEKALPIIEEGAMWYASAKEVAENSDVVFTIVGYPKDVREVYESMMSVDVKGKLFVDMTTTEPSLEKEIGKALGEKGASFIDAPVSGGDKGAREGTLSIMCGGEKEAVERAMKYFLVMGKTIEHLGPVGSGQHTKMANQILISGTMIGLCESLVYAKKAGLDLMQVISTLSKGAAGCWSLDNYGPRIVNGDFNPGFMVKHFVKDMKIAIDESRKMGLELKGLDLVERLYEEMEKEGEGNLGTHALYNAIERL